MTTMMTPRARPDRGRYVDTLSGFFARYWPILTVCATLGSSAGWAAGSYLVTPRQITRIEARLDSNRIALAVHTQRMSESRDSLMGLVREQNRLTNLLVLAQCQGHADRSIKELLGCPEDLRMRR